MTSIERPGINAKWLKRMKTWHKGNMKSWYDKFMPFVSEHLEYYVEHGFLKPSLLANPRSADFYASGPYMKWADIDGQVEMLGRLSEYEFQSAGMIGTGRFDVVLARRSFAAFYLKEMIGYSQRLESCDEADVLFTVLGIVLGCKDQAFRIARLRLDCWRQFAVEALVSKENDFINTNPIYTFMLSIIANYLNVAPYIPAAEELKEPIMKALLDCWREPDPAMLEPLCLAACDFHTHRCDDDGEFGYRHFMYMPIEILLLFKLRQWLGLDNPQLDHPLMNTPLGRLPDEVPFAYDGLLQRVQERMVKEGYDEAAILIKYYPDGNIPKP
jgi:hypothetical protein